MVDESLAKHTRSGMAYSIKLVGEWPKLALVGKRVNFGKAIKFHKEKAMKSMMTELRVLNKKGTFYPVDGLLPQFGYKKVSCHNLAL